MKAVKILLRAAVNYQRQQLNTRHAKFIFFLAIAFVAPLLSLMLPAVAQTTSGNQTQSIATASGSDHTKYILGLPEVFTFFMLMLGPIKVLVPFVKMTKGTDAGFRHKLAFRAALISTICTLAAAFMGKHILKSWHISIATLMLTAGIILFLVALQTIMQMYSNAPRDEGESSAPSLSMAVFPISIPTIVTPYGIAILIILMAAAQDTARQIGVIGVLLAIMFLNLLTMLFAHKILKVIGIITLIMLGTVIGVLQVALGVEIILRALTLLGVIVSQGG